MPTFNSLSRRSFNAFLLSGAAAAALAACGEGTTVEQASAPGGEPVAFSEAARNRPVTELHRGNGAEPGSLDPHQAQGTWESNIISEMLMGLMTEDAEAKPIYGAAESHTVSDDGLVWTFKLREHTWSDGTPVTADDFIYAWRRILDPKTAARYSNNLYDMKNARAANEGQIGVDQIGARALDPRTVEITLEHPAPYLLELLTHQTWFPVPKHKVEALGGRWTDIGNYAGNGPYMLAERIPNDHIRLVKNPRFYDAANVRIETVYFYPIEDTSSALKRFRAGELDVNDGIPLAQIDWMRANIPDALRLDPYLALSYFSLNVTKPPFDDIRLREALSLALDRATIADRIIKLGEAPAYTIVPPGTANYPGTARVRWADTPFPERLERARALMTEAGYGPQKRLSVPFNTGQGPDSKRVAAAIQEMLKAAYIDIEVQQSDSAVHYDLLKEGNFAFAAASWVGDFNDAKNFLFLLESANKGLNYSRWTDARFDELMNQANMELDAVKRGQLMAEAEQIALDAYAMLPNRYLNTRNLVQPYVKGWVGNLNDENRTRWLWIEGPRVPAGRVS